MLTLIFHINCWYEKQYNLKYKKKKTVKNNFKHKIVWTNEQTLHIQEWLKNWTNYFKNIDCKIDYKNEHLIMNLVIIIISI